MRHVDQPGTLVIMANAADIRLSFNSAAQIYDSARPTYPPALFDALFAALPDQPEVVEVGPGTGQATQDLLSRGAHVHAIELGEALANMLRSNHPTNHLTITVGDFETVEIADRSADALFSATAFHWISADAQLNRPAQILQPGQFAVFRLEPDL